MARSAAWQHIVAMLAAVALVVGLKVQTFDLNRIAHVPDAWFRIYTPYFPGLARLHEHEVFSPRYAHTHKIVFLGASAVDSVGCDSTWMKKDPTRIPEHNADASCSIAGQMNQLLAQQGVRNWRAFDLARNGSKLTPMLYVYAQLRPLKPDVVVFGDTFPYYMQDNADAQAVSPAQYAEMDAAFDAEPDTKAIWQDYRRNLQEHGLRLAPAAAAGPAEARRPVTLQGLLVGALTNARRFVETPGPPAPIQIKRVREWPVPGPGPAFHNPDAGLRYFQGISLMADGQRRDGQRFFFYFSPQYDRRADVAYQQGLEREFGGYLRRAGIPYVSLIAFPLKPDLETFDGVHQTMYGNRRLAAQLLLTLRQRGLVRTAP